ncbi:MULTISPECIES: DUF2023 family protein [unclassified Dysgonomonas]|uniref:DUF2023 family protein n=1 Tax=unclassified Dysgonomonas TaxID=2630389 RepID=UPI0013EDD1FA|nr:MULTISPECIES: DUF2023 family protein [unclassified Dysgonomonas]
MRLFDHLIYEFRKGVRDMVLFTFKKQEEESIKSRLERNGISYIIQPLNNGNVNIFFGKEECMVVVDKICKNKPLNRLTPEEDFILGILLGYSIKEQCNRYCKKHENAATKNVALCLA